MASHMKRFFIRQHKQHSGVFELCDSYSVQPGTACDSLILACTDSLEFLQGTCDTLNALQDYDDLAIKQIGRSL